METSNSIHIGNLLNSTNFIYITGCDGTGKTTQARLLIEQLAEKGINTCHLWLRYPFFFSIPLLIFARLRGHSWYENTNGFHHGYWDFRSSWMLRKLFPWTMLIDATLASIRRILIPLLVGRIIICERYVLDMLVDTSMAIGDYHFHQRVPGRLFLYLIPSASKILILNLGIESIHQRRSDLIADHRLQLRLDTFNNLAEDLSIPVLSSRTNPYELNAQIFDMVCN
jgi:hypothetical protein